MSCEKCGHKSNLTDTFCINCGNKLKKVSIQEEAGAKLQEKVNEFKSKAESIKNNENVNEAIDKIKEKASDVKTKINEIKDNEKINNTISDIKEKVTEKKSNYQSYSKSDMAFYTAENEVLIRRYECAEMHHCKGKGHLTITNKRIVFCSHGISLSGTAVNFSEVAIDTVNGVRTCYGKKINWILILIGSIMVVSFFRMLSDLYNEFQFIFSFILLGLGIWAIVKAFKPNYSLEIYSNGTGMSPISVGDNGFMNSVFGKLFNLVEEASPAKDSHTAMQEIGAIILDFKTMGDFAIDKWKVK